MRVFASFFVLVLSAVPLVGAQSAAFDVSLRGQTVGSASYRIRSTGLGIALESSAKVTTQGVEYAFSKTEEQTSDHRLHSADINAVLNGQAVHLTAAVEGNNFKLTTSANGRTTTANLAAHPRSVFLPDFDPGALQTLLSYAVNRYPFDIYVVIPRQAGTVAAVKVAPAADEKGTLEGKAIDVHHLVVTSDGAAINLFATTDNQLLLAELPQAGFALVRKGFVLTPPAKAPAPPVDDSAPSSGGAAPSPASAPVPSQTPNPAQK